MSYLPDPPCISYLIGCHDTDVNTSSNGGSSVAIPSSSDTSSSGDGRLGSLSGNDYTVPHTDLPNVIGSLKASLPSVRLPTVPSSLKLPTVNLPTVPSSLKLPTVDLAALKLPSFSIKNPFLGKKSELFAVYDVKLQNPLQNPLSGLSMSHGPVPFGAVFDPTMSAPGCSLLQRITGCSMNLGAGETRSFPIAYKVSNAAFCRLSPVLNSVKVVLNGSAAPVTSSVRCEVKDGATLWEQLNGAYAGSSGSFLNAGASDAQGTMLGGLSSGGTASGTAAGTMGLSTTKGSDGIGNSSGMIGQTDNTLLPTPKTGSDDQYYASMNTSDFLSKHVSDPSVPSVSYGALFWVASLSLFVLLLAIKTKKNVLVNL